MRTDPLHELGREASTILGTMTFGPRVDAEGATAMVEECLDVGVTHFDTANVYGQGEAEQLLGQAIKGRRDAVTVATKCGLPMTDAPEQSGLRPEAIRANLDASLARLGVDDVDLFYLHAPDPQVPMSESLGAMWELQGAGKIRNVGLSNYAAWQHQYALDLAAAKGQPPPVVAQLQYNLVSRGIDEEYAAFAEANGAVTYVYNPLAGGLLTGKYTDRSQIPSAGRFADMPGYLDRYWQDATFDVVEALTDIARQAQVPLTELALRWVGGRPVANGVIVGASSLEQLRENLRALRAGPLPKDVQDACDVQWERLRGPFPRYCR